MRVLSLVLLVFALTVVTAVDKPKIYDLNDAPKLFEKFIKDNDRHYKDEADKQIHYDTFVNSLKYINQENAKGHSYTLGITSNADLSPEEMSRRFGLRTN